MYNFLKSKYGSLFMFGILDLISAAGGKNFQSHFSGRQSPGLNLASPTPLQNRSYDFVPSCIQTRHPLRILEEDDPTAKCKEANGKKKAETSHNTSGAWLSDSTTLHGYLKLGVRILHSGEGYRDRQTPL